jgi:hypothetical protein
MKDFLLGALCAAAAFWAFNGFRRSIGRGSLPACEYDLRAINLARLDKGLAALTDDRARWLLDRQRLLDRAEGEDIDSRDVTRFLTDVVGPNLTVH